MGATNFKPAPHRIEPEATGVEIFQDPTPEPSQESSNHKRQKAVAPAQSASTNVVRTIMQEPAPQINVSDTTSEGKQKVKEEKQKKKRRKSKKEKNKAPPTLVRAQTQLNELKNVKPLLQQNPQMRQQHSQQTQDACALDEEAKKAPSSDSRSRFFNFDSWRKSPLLPSDKADLPTIEPITLSQSNGVAQPCSRNSISNDVEDIEDSRDLSDVESIPLPPASRTTAITAPTLTATPNFLSTSNQVEYGRPDIQTTPVIRVKTSDRRTPEKTKHSLRSQRSDLHLDDVDEDLMEHILTYNHH